MNLYGNGRVAATFPSTRPSTRNPATGGWSYRDTSTGRFMDVKQSGGTFAGVRRELPPRTGSQHGPQRP